MTSSTFSDIGACAATGRCGPGYDSMTYTPLAGPDAIATRPGTVQL